MDAGCLSTLAVGKRGESIGENIRNRRGGRDAHIQVIWASPRGYRSSSVSEATSTCVACMATGVLLNTTPLTLTSIPALSSANICAALGRFGLKSSKTVAALVRISTPRMTRLGDAILSTGPCNTTSVLG